MRSSAPDPNGADAQREAEAPEHPGGYRCGCEGGPVRGDGIVETGSEHWSAEHVGIDAGTLAERELQVLEPADHCVGLTEGGAGRVAPTQHDPGSAHVEQRGARAAQPRAGTPAATPLFESCDDLDERCWFGVGSARARDV